MKLNRKSKVFLAGMCLATALTILPRSVSASYGGNDIIELGEVYLEHKHFFDNSTANLPIGSTAQLEYDLGVNIVLLQNLYFNNIIMTQTDQTQFRGVGWNYRFGVQIMPWLDTAFQHMSIHAMDALGGPWIEDEWVVRVQFFRGTSVRPIWQ